MSRYWLTSTTALALALNTVAPMPSVASQTALSERTAPKSELRLAENAASPAAEDVVPGVSGEVPNEGSGESNTAADIKAQAAEAAEAAADVEPEVKAAAEAKAQAEAEEAATIGQEEAEYPDPEAEAATEEQPDAAAAALTEAQAQQKDAEERAKTAGEEAIDAQTEAEDAVESQADSNPAVQSQADAEAAEAKEHEAAAEKAQEDADKALAEANAKEKQAEADKAQEDADKANAEAATQAPQDAAEGAASSAEPAAPEQAPEEIDTPNTDSTKNDTSDEIPEISAEDQASAAEAADASSGAAAAASDEGKVVDTQEGTVTKEQSRASNEEFNTTASGKETTPAPAAEKKDNDLLKAVGVVAAAGLGAYAVGKLLNNGGKVVSNTGDRAVVQEPSGAYRIIKDDDTLLRRPGSEVQTQTYSDGSTRSTVTEADGSSTVTVRAADGRVLRRTRVLADGQNVVLFDDTQGYERVDVSKLRQADQAAAARNYDYSTQDVDQLRAALNAANGQLPDRSYSLNQIRQIAAVRHLVPVIALDAISFKTGSAVIDAGEAQSLAALGNAMRDAIQKDPSQVFLVEGHTDTVGAASANLALSDRRAESVALALTEYFNVSPANMIVQGYGESDLRVREAGDVRANRRGAVRNITPLLGRDR